MSECDFDREELIALAGRYYDDYRAVLAERDALEDRVEALTDVVGAVRRYYATMDDADYRRMQQALDALGPGDAVD